MARDTSRYLSETSDAARLGAPRECIEIVRGHSWCGIFYRVRRNSVLLVSPAHAAPPLNAISLHSLGYSTRLLSLILIVWNPALVELVMASNVYSNYLSGKGLSATRAWPCVTGYAAEVYRKFRYYDFYRSSCQFKGRRTKFHVILYILIKSGREYLKEVSELFS